MLGKLLIFLLISLLVWFQVVALNSGNLKNPNFDLSNDAGVSVNFIAASINNVPEPQKGSYIGVLLSHSVKSIIDAAKFSFIGAEVVDFLYPLLWSEPPPRSMLILALFSWIYKFNNKSGKYLLTSGRFF